MKFLFVDETDRQEQAATRAFFCLCGLMIDGDKVIPASNALEAIKEKYGLANLKDARKTGLDEETRLAMATEICEVLSSNGAKVIGIVLGQQSMSSKLPKEEMYMGAAAFLMERFALSLYRDSTIGAVIFDSLNTTTQTALRKSFYEHVRAGVVQMAWNASPTCALKDHVLPTLLFTDDEQSLLIQAVDLVATSLNSGIVNTTRKTGAISVDALPEGNKFLSIYWPLFARSPAGRVDGWGVKNWD